MLKKLCALLIFLFAALPSQTFASGKWISAHPKFPVLIYRGSITPAMTADLLQLLQSHPDTTTIALHSGGGSVYAALEVAQEIDRRGLNTVVMKGDTCLSACSLIFFAGNARYAHGRLGVHQISGADDASITQFVVADIYENLIRFGVDSRILSAMFRTASDDIHIFTETEIATFEINRDSKTPSSFASENTGGVTLEVVASTKNGDWEAALLRNEQNGHLLCALEAVSTGMTFRIVYYMTKDDAFVEILNPPFPMRQGAQVLHFAFRKKNQEPWVVAIPSYSKNPDSAWFDIENEDQGLLLLGAVGLANMMLIQSDDGKLLGLYDLGGSLRSAQAFSRCMKS